ncbi:hypothetical protein K3152_03845 [Qipengyuania sp. 1NDH17]|uniref:Uncharacterized protein n=1 Tax=Qipengyuania polymorpha TaxID=2867234 RepID=A0ABS7IV96_9SPHN|nr:hypothetical protein [Qipengyuania polymorpha]MBX7457371.1 hypothetical protein [Qipengyuania polymorpha]
MEYEILDEPQGIDEDDEATRDGGLVEDHVALKNQSSVKPQDYPMDERRDSYLITPQQEG